MLGFHWYWIQSMGSAFNPPTQISIPHSFIGVQDNIIVFILTWHNFIHSKGIYISIIFLDKHQNHHFAMSVYI